MLTRMFPALGREGAEAKPVGSNPHRLWSIVALVSWSLGGVLYATLPPCPDQFELGYLGWRILEGDLPYRDFLDMNWPGILALHAAATGLFGNHLWSWRVLDFLILAASAPFLGGLVKRAAGDGAARIALLLYPLLYAGLSIWVPGQQDMSAAHFLLGALWCHVRAYEEKKAPWQIGAGLFLAAAALIKPTTAVLGLLLPLHAIALKVPFRTVLRHTAIAGGISAAALLATLGGLLSRGLSFREIQDAVWTFNAETQFQGAQALPVLALRALVVHVRWWPALTLGSLPALFWILRPANRSFASTALPMLWVAGILSYVAQRRGYGYHLSPCFPALAGGLAVSLALLGDGRLSFGDALWKKHARTAFVLLLLAGAGAKVAVSYAPLASALIARDYDRFLSRFSEGGGWTTADIVEFSRRLDRIAAPGEPVLIVDSDCAINYLSRRRNPTRFYLFHVLILSAPPLPMSERWLDQWERDLAAADVRFCLVSRNVEADWLQGESRAARALRGFLTRYRPSETLGSCGPLRVYEQVGLSAD
jgi:hypothetical protein